MAGQQADLLHPLTSLEWRKCTVAPVRIRGAEAIQFNKKLYFRARYGNTILCLDSDLKSWTSIKSPTHNSALASYQGKLVLIGGEEITTGKATNKLLSLQDDGTWSEELPPMLTARMFPTAVSTSHHILVVNGAEVEVFDGSKWSRAQPLPEKHGRMTSIICNGELYLMELILGRLFSASVDDLIASASAGERVHNVWKSLPRPPVQEARIGTFGGHLLAVHSRTGGEAAIYGSGDVYAFIPDTLSWLHVGDLPEPMKTPIAILSDELVVVNLDSNIVYKASLQVKSFPDGQLSISALERLQCALKLPLLKSVGLEVTPHVSDPEEHGRAVIKEWLRMQIAKPVTWRSFLSVLASSATLDSLLDAVISFFVVESDEVIKMKQQLVIEEATLQHLREGMEGAMRRKEEEKRAMTRKKEEKRAVRFPTYLSLDTAMGEEEITMHQPMKKEGEQKMAAEVKRLVAERDRAMTEKDAAVAERDALAAEKDELRSQIHQRKSSTITMGYLRGVVVVAETSFEVTSQPLTYEWRGHGLKIHIPQDSLPADCSQCRVEIRASLSGQYSLPANCELVSGVYWIHCPVKFSKHVVLEIQHSRGQSGGLSFVRAVCTQQQLPYSFQRLGGGVFSEHSSHGSISLSRFSGWGIVARKIRSFFRQSNSQQYSAQVCYADAALNSWQVLFTIRRRSGLELEDTVFHQRLEGIIKRELSKVEFPFPVEFAANCIELEVPETFLGWKLKHPSHPAVLKSVVDSFRGRPSDLLPCCQLRVTCDGAQAGSTLEKKVILKGAKEPYNYFFLECGPTSAGAELSAPEATRSVANTGITSGEGATADPDGQTSSQTEPSASGSQAEATGESQCDPQLNMMNLTRALRRVADWETLGIWLGVEKCKIDEIAQKRSRDPHHCKMDLLAHWLESTSNASWENVAMVLEEMGLQRVADEVRTAHCS